VASKAMEDWDPLWRCWPPGRRESEARQGEWVGTAAPRLAGSNLSVGSDSATPGGGGSRGPSRQNHGAPQGGRAPEDLQPYRTG
jgi:hypothetical protein